MTHEPGGWVKLQGGGRLPQVETTFEYLWLQMPEREDNPKLTGGGIGAAWFSAVS